MAAAPLLLRLGLLLAALGGFWASSLAGQQMLSALYLPQIERALSQKPQPDLASARASLAYAQTASASNPELPRYQVRLAQLEASQTAGLPAWQARYRALRVLERTLRQRPAWGQGWAYLALLRGQLGQQPVPAVGTAWRLGLRLAPYEGLALPALCQVAAQQPSWPAQALRCPP